ncbi:hypothetical protein LCGC14_2267260, partial [marine sediment metagenome]
MVKGNQVKKPVMLLFDFMNLFYRSLHVNKELYFANEFTGALYGVAMQIAATLNVVRPKIAIVCKDTKPYFRTNDYPEFKANRKRSQDSVSQKMISGSLKQCDELFQLIGLPVLQAVGMEADDLIAAQVKLNNPDWKIVVASNDSDLYQLFTVPDFRLYKGKQKGFYAKGDFMEDYDGLSPKDWIEVIALTGGHNSLP